MDWISVADAAAQLNVSERQVRRLAEAGSLVARRVGSSWLISPDSVRERNRSSISSGRPVSPRLAWAVLAAVDAVIAGVDAERAVAQAGRDLPERWDRRRLRQLLAGAPEPAAWDRWLRRRAELRRVWVHPGVLGRFLADPRVHAGGAAATVGLGGAVGDVEKCYVAASDVDDLIAAYRARDDADGQVVLAVVPDDARAHLGEPGRPVPAAVGFVDCVDAADSRQQHVAVSHLADARRVLSSAGGV